MDDFLDYEFHKLAKSSQINMIIVIYNRIIQIQYMKIYVENYKLKNTGQTNAL